MISIEQNPVCQFEQLSSALESLTGIARTALDEYSLYLELKTIQRQLEQVESRFNTLEV